MKVPLSARIFQKRPKIYPKSEISWKIGLRCFPNWAQNGRRPPLGASHVCFRAPQGDYKHAAWPTRGTHLSHLAPSCLPLGPQHSRFVTRDVPKPPKDIFGSHIFPFCFSPHGTLSKIYLESDPLLKVPHIAQHHRHNYTVLPHAHRTQGTLRQTAMNSHKASSQRYSLRPRTPRPQDSASTG